ncbi:hypothetical protein ACTQ1O_12530 [Bilifractor sp. LCP21S3_A7]
MGKTSLAQSYLEAYGRQYFSFRNLDTVAVVDLKSLLGQKNKELF